MESSVKQFGVIHHQSQINSPELGSNGEKKKEERKKLGALHYLGVFQSD